MSFVVGLFALLCLVGSLALFWLVGRRNFVSAIHENDEAAQLVDEFHGHLIDFVNSDGQNGAAYHKMTFLSHRIERVLGHDNFVYGARVGMYHLQGAPLLPLALQELRGEFGLGGYSSRGKQIPSIIENVLVRHIGRRQTQDTILRKDLDNVGKCIALGWSSISAIPIAVLEAFGIISAARGQKARATIAFKLWSFLLAVAAIAGPVIGYLADQSAIHAAVTNILH